VTLQETAYAKINLALHVRRKRADGYHDLETLFAFAEQGDLLSADPADALTLSLSGPFASSLAGEVEADNLVLRAAYALRAAYSVSDGAALRLDKCLPVASGIGGGSADAAAALRLLCRLWRIDASQADLVAIAQGLGADVPACIASETVRGDGRGDALRAVDVAGVTGTAALLVNPGVPVSTPAVFAGWDGCDRGPLPDLGFDAFAVSGRNDLEAPALKIQPIIGEVLARLNDCGGVRLARMSGSGATCFALFDDSDACADAAALMEAEYRTWWRLQTKLR
jgi:4-diphosphocytidyl-2-C-methyl-D-erythritol kinase